MKFKTALKWLKTVPLHPFYFALFPLLLFYAVAGLLEKSNEGLIFPVAAVVVLTGLVYPTLNLVLHNPDKASVIATLFWWMFYSVTFMFIIKEQTQLHHVEMSTFWQTLSLIAIWVVIFLLTILIVISTKASERISAILNQAGFFLVLLELLAIIEPSLELHLLQYPQLVKAFPRQDERPVNQAEDKPDIYYVVVDEMTSPDNLKRCFGYDNSAYLRRLENLGFFVPTQSHSNYAMTRLCLASTLNMSYLNKISSVAGPRTDAWGLLSCMIRDSKVGRILKNAGYRYVHIGSSIGATWFNPNADINMALNPIDYSAEMLIKESLLGLFPGTFRFFDNNRRQQNLAMFQALKTVASSQYPKFVFAHIIMPHEPFLFGPNGEAFDCIDDTNGGKWGPSMKAGYIMQVRFTEKMLTDTVEEILRRSKTSPIIIIQGDHGTASSGFLVDPKPNEEQASERMGIFNAYLVPASCRKSLYKTITPVNSFRAILKTLYGMPFERLEDRSYFSGYHSPFSFTEVTELLPQPTEQLPQR